MASLPRFACVGALCTLAFVSAPAFADADHPTFLRLSPADAAQLTADDIAFTVVDDHGAFVWARLDAGLDDVRAAGVTAPAADFRLHLGDRSFDPLTEAAPDVWAATPATGGSDLHLVQMRGPIHDAWRTALEAEGLSVLQYIHPFTYVVWGDTAASATVARGHERWRGPFLPAYRVLPRWRTAGENMTRYDALVVRAAGVDRVIDQLATAGATIGSHRTIDQRFAIVSFDLPGTALERAAGIAGVYSIQPEPTDGGLRSEMSNQVNVNNVNGANLAQVGYNAWLSNVGLSGAGVIMANVDGGIQDNHPDLVNRMLPCTGSTCGGATTDSHGTHTAGIMAADGASGTTDGGGFLRGLGMAPGANLVEQLYFPTFTQPGGMLTLMKQSHDNDAVLSGNSWGPAGSPRGYDNDTLQVDIGVRDARDDVAGNQMFTYVLSFMNGNGGTSSQGSPDEAKNLFNIGSTKMRTGGGTQDTNINDLSANSAHGPALDGRTIPHMVAPGCLVDSTLPTNNYGLNCGTSMASPHVAGATGLFYEYYRNLAATEPTPALIKAAFLPVAHDLAGFRDADGGILGHPFDSKQGWGRMDTEAVLDPQLAVLYFDDPQVFDNTGEVWEVEVTPEDPNEPMRMMLVWTDAPGHGLGGSTPAWNNDLDLEAVAGADTYLGNVFDANGWSTTGGTADGINNTEGIFLGPAAPATVTIRVTATNIGSDGIPVTGDATDQDFALVCYNCQQEGAEPIFADDFGSGDASAWAATVP